MKVQGLFITALAIELHACARLPLPTPGRVIWPGNSMGLRVDVCLRLRLDLGSRARLWAAAAG